MPPAGTNGPTNSQTRLERWRARAQLYLVWGGIAVAEERARAVHELGWAPSLSYRISYPILVSGTQRRGRLFHLDRL